MVFRRKEALTGGAPRMWPERKKVTDLGRQNSTRNAQMLPAQQFFTALVAPVKPRQEWRSVLDIGVKNKKKRKAD